MAEYKIIRSQRRTMSLEVKRNGEIIVRAPFHVSEQVAAQFVSEHQKWIQGAQKRQEARQQAHPEPTPAEQAALIERARTELPRKVAEYAERMALYPTGLKITSARTRFGSCSGKNSLCFSWRLMDYPEAAIDYVVVHELAHIAHKNHGPKFWALVEQYMPDYKACRAMLRQ